MNNILHENVPVTKLVDGGYLTWAHGAVGFKSWYPVKHLYTRRAGALICLDSRHSLRKEFYPEYKSHRKAHRERRERIHQKVLFFQEYIREDPMLRTWEEDGLEADDLIALLAPKFKLPVVAIDKDLLQMDGIRINKLDETELTVAHFASKQPKRVQPMITQPIDVLFTLVMLGDKSDDIPRLIPARNLELLVNLWSMPSPWKSALKVFGKALLRNLYLAVLPSPWCFNPIPSPEQVFEIIASGDRTTWKLRKSIVEFMTSQSHLLAGAS